MGQPADAFDWVRDRPGHDRRCAIDPAKLRTELGWRPQRTDFIAGLRETIAWCRENEPWWAAAKDTAEKRYAEREQGGDLPPHRFSQCPENRGCEQTERY